MAALFATCCRISRDMLRLFLPTTVPMETAAAPLVQNIRFHWTAVPTLEYASCAWVWSTLIDVWETFPFLLV